MAREIFERTTFSDLISAGALEIGDGYRAKNEELGGSGLLFLRAGHVTDTHIDFAGVERFHAELEKRVRSKLAKPGDADHQGQQHRQDDLRFRLNATVCLFAAP